MKHWEEREFQNWLYGLCDDDSHLRQCPQCGAEAARLTERRRLVTADPGVSHEFLAAQRREIHARLGQAPRHWAPVRWAVSVAMLLVVMLSATIAYRGRQAQPLFTNSDQELFSDLQSMDQSNEPRAISPIHSLFEK
jgi:hypothetical protein